MDFSTEPYPEYHAELPPPIVYEIGSLQVSTPGQPGRDGERGLPGRDGVDGQPGRDGVNGKSAYQIAVDNGFRGSVAQWLESLKGTPGQSGVPGIVGGTAHFAGIGFPEGVVSANVGSVYTDKNATNGAIRWIKKSGTGNTGWVVLHGDTDWRNIGATLINGWKGNLLIRRVNDKVFLKSVLYVGLDGGVATSPQFMVMPAGFVITRRRFANYDVLGDSYTNIGVNRDNVVREFDRIRTGEGWKRGFNIEYQTDDLWPAVLPGDEA